MALLHVSVLSPEKKVAEALCTEALLPTTTGIIAVLPNHAPLATVLAAGMVELHEDNGQVIHLAITGGFATVSKNQLTLLTDFAARHDEIDEKVILQAKAAAEKMLIETKTDSELAHARTELLRATLQLQLLEKHRHHHFSPTP